MTVLIGVLTRLGGGTRRACAHDGSGESRSGGPGSNEETSSEEVPMAFLLELWAFLRTRKKFWLLPVIVTMVIFGGLVVLSNGSVIAPFVYTLF
jgi:Family of unknown function (DUF5989)